MCLLGLIGNLTLAQTDINLDPETGCRLSVGFDKKIVKGLHISFSEELRLDNNFSSLDRFQTSLGATYKVNDYLKMGVGYALINGYSDSLASFKSPRHRLYIDITGSYRLGDWRIALRERIQTTHRTDNFNTYQNTENVWVLKSRLKVIYKGMKRLEPYGSMEVSNMLNAPVITATYKEATDTWVSSETGLAKNEAGWFLDGFNGMYVSRVRATLGASYRLDRRNTIEVYLMGDYNIEKEVDANAEGTKLKAYTRKTGFVGWIGANYSYSF